MALVTLTNAAAGNAGAGTAQFILGGDIAFVATGGSFGGGTCTIEVSYDGGTTYQSTGIALTAAGTRFLSAPGGLFRTNITGGSGGAITVRYENTVLANASNRFGRPNNGTRTNS